MSVNSPETPLVSTGTADEAVGALFIPSADENFADDAATKAWIEDNLLPLISEAESEGVEQRSEWSAIREML